ncbi:MAG: AMP-binding protein [Nocardiopsaceae bacterium]|nr:AMP-binding protein [Nocardiopsaceae bacterium]
MGGDPRSGGLGPARIRLIDAGTDDEAGPVGSLTGGLLDRLRRRDLRATVVDSRGNSTDTVIFAGTIERAAAGLSRRGTHPGDVIGILAPVSLDRLTAVYTVMAAGGIALPLELDSDLETLIDILTASDVRLLLVAAPLSEVALELADRSRVRQVIAFGDAPETTPFGELLLPSPDGSGYDPARGLFHNGLLGYQATDNGVCTTLSPHDELLNMFHRFSASLQLTSDDTVAVGPGMPESVRAVLAALAMWNGAAVVAPAGGSGQGARGGFSALDVTVGGCPTPARVGPVHHR